MSEKELNAYQLGRAMAWLLEEAQCYEGCQWINNPHEAARRITKYFDELKETDLDKYKMQLSVAISYGMLTPEDNEGKVIP